MKYNIGDHVRISTTHGEIMCDEPNCSGMNERMDSLAGVVFIVESFLEHGYQLEHSQWYWTDCQLVGMKSKEPKGITQFTLIVKHK